MKRTSCVAACAARVLSAAFAASTLAPSPAFSAFDPAPDKYGVYADFGNGYAWANVSPTSASVSLQDATGYLQGSALAGPTLGVQSSANTLGVVSHDDPAPLLRTGAGVRIVDGFVSGTGDSVQVPISMFLDGALGVEVTPYGIPTGHFNNYAYIYVGFGVIPASGPGQSYAAGHMVAAGNAGGALLDGRDGFGFVDHIAWQQSFGRDAFSGVVQSDLLTLPVNQLFELDINITAVAQTSVYGPSLGADLNFTATAYVDFLHTLAFAAGTPVLGLPAGYTFDAPSVGIANNLCSGPGCIATSVPELPTGALLLSGILLLTTASARLRGREVPGAR